MSDAPPKNCTTCRSSFAVPNMQGKTVCRRFPPAAVLVGSMQMAGAPSQPLFDIVFPSVSELIVCDEYKIKAALLPSDGNVTRMET